MAVTFKTLIMSATNHHKKAFRRAVDGPERVAVPKKKELESFGSAIVTFMQDIETKMPWIARALKSRRLPSHMVEHYSLRRQRITTELPGKETLDGTLEDYGYESETTGDVIVRQVAHECEKRNKINGAAYKHRYAILLAEQEQAEALEKGAQAGGSEKSGKSVSFSEKETNGDAVEAKTDGLRADRGPTKKEKSDHTIESPQELSLIHI